MRKPETHILRKAPRVCAVLGCHEPATTKCFTVPSLLDESLGVEVRTLFYCEAHKSSASKPIDQSKGE